MEFRLYQDVNACHRLHAAKRADSNSSQVTECSICNLTFTREGLVEDRFDSKLNQSCDFYFEATVSGAAWQGRPAPLFPSAFAGLTLIEIKHRLHADTNRGCCGEKQRRRLCRRFIASTRSRSGDCPTSPSAWRVEKSRNESARSTVSDQKGGSPTFVLQAT